MSQKTYSYIAIAFMMLAALSLWGEYLWINYHGLWVYKIWLQPDVTIRDVVYYNFENIVREFLLLALYYTASIASSYLHKSVSLMILRYTCILLGMIVMVKFSFALFFYDKFTNYERYGYYVVVGIVCLKTIHWLIQNKTHDTRRTN